MHSFNAKLSIVFLVLVFGLTAAVGWLCLQASRQLVDETEQKLNHDLAQVMAVDFQPFLRDSIDHVSIRQKIEYLIGINPRIDIYLLGSTGMIKALFVESGQTPVQAVLDIGPMDRMLAGAALPIWGDDPLQAGRKKPFSVAPLEIMGEQGCYLYIVLGSERYDSTAALLQDSYIMQTLLKGLALALLVTGVVGLFLFALLTRRLRRMSQVVLAFGKGQHHRRVHANTRDEIGQLGNTFNKMADTLQANVQALKETDQQRRELIANVSHDLRSPLSSIQGYLETTLIKLDTLTPDKLRVYLDTALKNARKLNNLVIELFELSKLDAKQVRPDLEAFSMLDLVHDVAMPFRPQAEAAGIHLAVELPDQAPMVHADIALVERAITNLIDNALRYTPPGGTVRVLAAVEGQGVRVRVADTGIGIAAEDLPHIFERFYRADKSRGHERGAGLGLAIAKKILELHNTTLSVQSAVNKGTTFSFTLPTGQPQFA